MPQTIIIIVILVLVLVVYWLVTGKKFNKPNNTSEQSEHHNTTVSRNGSIKKEENKTGFVPLIIMDQTTEKGMIIDSFEIANIPAEGITISRPGAPSGDIFLSAKGKDAATVGTEGLIIGKDEKGMFGKLYENGHKKNKLYLFNSDTKELCETDQFDITDGTVICMGSQWLRFRKPEFPAVPSLFTAPRDPRPVAIPEPYKKPEPVFAPRENNNKNIIKEPEIKAPVIPDQHPQNPPQTPSGFSFETTIDKNGRFVIKKE